MKSCDQERQKLKLKSGRGAHQISRSGGDVPSSISPHGTAIFEQEALRSGSDRRRRCNRPSTFTRALRQGGAQLRTCAAASQGGSASLSEGSAPGSCLIGTTKTGGVGEGLASS